MAVTATILASCGGAKTTTAEADKFDYTVEQFADLQILRYKVPGFEELTLKQKELIYYLTEAALEGRDILFDQNGKYNLRIRRMLEAVYTNYQGDKTTPDFKNMEVYLKRVWFSNGIHHHYGTEKFVPNFSQDFLKQAVQIHLPDDPNSSVLSFSFLLNCFIFPFYGITIKPDNQHNQNSFCCLLNIRTYHQTVHCIFQNRK